MRVASPGTTSFSQRLSTKSGQHPVYKDVPMPDKPTRNVTGLLREWRDGDRAALDRLMPLVYDELRRLARRHMAGERRDHTLQPTALVHEAFGRLIDADIPWNDRVHFFAVAATTMRRILVEHARKAKRAKRGGGADAGRRRRGRATEGDRDRRARPGAGPAGRFRRAQGADRGAALLRRHDLRRGGGSTRHLAGHLPP